MLESTRGSIMRRCKRYAEGLVHCRAALEADRTVHGPDSLEATRASYNLATSLSDVGDKAGSVRVLDSVLSYYARHGLQDSPDNAQALEARGVAHADTGQYEKALELFLASLACRRAIFSPDHPEIAKVMRRIAEVYNRLGRCALGNRVGDAANTVQRRSQSLCAAQLCGRKLREDGAPLDRCAGCLRTYYCSAACQAADWKARHKAECKALAAGDDLSNVDLKGDDPPCDGCVAVGWWGVGGVAKGDVWRGHSLLYMSVKGDSVCCSWFAIARLGLLRMSTRGYALFVCMGCLVPVCPPASRYIRTHFPAKLSCADPQCGRRLYERGTRRLDAPHHAFFPRLPL